MSPLPAVENKVGAVKLLMPQRHSPYLHAQQARCGEVASGVAVASLCTHSGALYSFPIPPHPMAKKHNQVALYMAPMPYLTVGGM